MSDINVENKREDTKHADRFKCEDNPADSRSVTHSSHSRLKVHAGYTMSISS